MDSQSWNDIFSTGDKALIESKIREHADNCESRNSNCLHEMFCPDCPLGGLPVISGRNGL